MTTQAIEVQRLRGSGRGLPLSSRRHGIIHIDLHRRGLLYEADTQHQAVAFFFAQENSVNSLQRTPNH